MKWWVNGYLQVLKDLCFLSKSARPSTSASNVSGDSYLEENCCISFNTTK